MFRQGVDESDRDVKTRHDAMRSARNNDNNDRSRVWPELPQISFDRLITCPACSLASQGQDL